MQDEVSQTSVSDMGLKVFLTGQIVAHERLDLCE